MGKANFTEEFKRHAVLQVTEGGYPGAEVSQRLGVGQHSSYELKKKFGALTGKEGRRFEPDDIVVETVNLRMAKLARSRNLGKAAFAKSPNKHH